MFWDIPILILNKIPSDSLSISFREYVKFYQTQMTGGQEQNIIRNLRRFQQRFGIVHCWNRRMLQRLPSAGHGFANASGDFQAGQPNMADALRNWEDLFEW